MALKTTPTTRTGLRLNLLTKILFGSIIGGSLVTAGIFTYMKVTAVEICDNGIDDDGDGKIDSFDPDCSLDSDGDGIVDFVDRDDDNDGIPDEVECAGGGSRQYGIVNGGFENPVIGNTTYRIMNQREINGWFTTASDQQMELWSTGFNGITAYEGRQFAELNANMVAADYQIITTIPGDVLHWSFAHRGRGSSTVPDVMQIEIGPNGSAYNYSRSFSDNNTAWGYYSDTYIVPAGQTLTRFALTAISTASGSNSVGNFVDDFRMYSSSDCQLDSDRDGIPNSLDLDSDNDGIPDLVEAGGADNNGDGRVDGYTSSTNPGSLMDTDGDGWYDKYDDDGTGRLGLLDSDADGILNFQDLDSDNDGIPDLIETGGTDADGDGRVDDANPDGTLVNDADHDGFSDTYDPDDDGVFGVEDAIGPIIKASDTNDDGFADSWPAFDNDSNPATANVKPDFDGDGVPNFIDLDSDNDGIADLIESGGIDTDGNGKVDGLLSSGSFSPSNDADEDGFYDGYDPDNNATNTDEANTSRPLAVTVTSGTGAFSGHPALADYAGNASLNGGHNMDQDRDGMPNYLDLDSDNDGITDLVETWGYGNDDASGEANDGFVDGWASNNSIRDGWHDSFDAGVLRTTADGGTTESALNTLPNYQTGAGKPDLDGDGLPNYLDIDSDGDGIVDLIESQPSGLINADPFDGLRVPESTDADYNGLQSVFDPLESGGSYIIPVNTDGADNPDYLDTDTDNDTFADVLEGHDVNNDGVADFTAGGIDADLDGLDDQFDTSTTSVASTASNQAVQDSKNDLLTGGERDWRDGAVSTFPVEWLDVSVEQAGSNSLLRWSTAREINSDYYGVERSLDGTMFENVGQVNAVGTSDKVSNYTFLDKGTTSMGNVRLYYRLRQVDLDGTTDYSNRVELSLSPGAAGISMKIYPNPVSDEATLELNSITRTTDVRIVNTSGQVVYSKSLSAQDAWQTQINVSSWTAGIYIVSVMSGTEKLQQKLIVR